MLHGTVNHAMKNEPAKITDIPYKAGTVNHATRLKRRRLLILACGRVRGSGMEQDELRKRAISC